jgi:hypothetical protein
MKAVYDSAALGVIKLTLDQTATSHALTSRRLDSPVLTRLDTGAVRLVPAAIDRGGTSESTTGEQSAAP